MDSFLAGFLLARPVSSCSPILPTCFYPHWVCPQHWLINYKDTTAKCRRLKKLTRKGLRQMFICLRPPPLLGFCLGWCSNFVGSETGQIQIVKLLQNMVSNRTPYCPPLHTVYIYTAYLFTQGRGRAGWKRNPRPLKSVQCWRFLLKEFFFWCHLVQHMDIWVLSFLPVEGNSALTYKSRPTVTKNLNLCVAFVPFSSSITNNFLRSCSEQHLPFYDGQVCVGNKSPATPTCLDFSNQVREQSWRHHATIPRWLDFIT